MAQTYRACLIGCGRMGATIDDEVRGRPDSELFLPYSHAAAIEACARLDFVATCDPVEEKAEEARQRYGAGKAYGDYRAMIDAEKPDIVCIATRPSPHVETVEYAASHGVKGVYCEKPLCNSMAEADRMLAACRDNGVKFNYGTQRRYVALYRQVRALIEAGELGDIQAIVAHCGASAAQWGHTHAADMLLYLAGDGEAEYVQATAVADESDWDGERLTKDAPIQMGYVCFKNGVHAYLVAAGGYEFEISGTKGKIRTTDNGSGYVWRRPDENGRLQPVADAPPAPIESGTLRALEDLVRAVDGDGTPQGDIALACRSQELVLGMIESHRQGGARVPLPLAARQMAVAPDHY